MERRTEYCNIPPSIEAKIGRNLHLQKNHPIEIVLKKIYEYFKGLDGYDFHIFDNLPPYASVENNFDLLLIPSDHVARSRSDTYYVNENTVLRTHTSAHQNELLAKGYNDFLVTGDVYRKDEIDKSHYPVFHQMEAVFKIRDGKDAKDELLRVLNGLVEHLFPGCEYKVRDHHFPFTDPSFEYDVLYNGDWLEILGCGVTHQKIVEHNGREGKYVALGLGVDRLAMLFMKIPDIRLLWSTHPRFLEQFESGEMVEFKPYSELPNMFKDISFWIPNNQIVDDVDEDTGEPCKKWLQENDFYGIVREIVGDNVEAVELKDEFFHPKKKKHSRMYRIVYSPTDPDLKDPSVFTDMCNSIQQDIIKEVSKLDIEIR